MTLQSLVKRLVPILAAVGEGVLLPVGVFLSLSSAGASDVIALTGSAAASVILLGLGWLRTRTVNTLGLVVLLRFVLSLALLGITNDARVLLVKDAVLTCVTGLAILATLRLSEPFILRVQRDMAPNRNTFDQQLRRNLPLKRVFRENTLWWGLGLSIEPFLEILIIYNTRLATAVILTNTIGTILILSLIIFTQLTIQRTKNPDETVADP